MPADTSLHQGSSPLHGDANKSLPMRPADHTWQHLEHPLRLLPHQPGLAPSHALVERQTTGAHKTAGTKPRSTWPHMFADVPEPRQQGRSGNGCGAQGRAHDTHQCPHGPRPRLRRGVAVNGVYSFAKADRKAGWFLAPAQASPRLQPHCLCSNDDPKWIPKPGRFAGKRMSLVCTKGIWTASLAGGEVTGETLQIALCRAIVLRELLVGRGAEE